jgi:hypothetical protein
MVRLQPRKVKMQTDNHKIETAGQTAGASDIASSAVLGIIRHALESFHRWRIQRAVKKYATPWLVKQLATDGYVLSDDSTPNRLKWIKPGKKYAVVLE